MYEISNHYGGSVQLQFDSTKHHYTIDGKTVDGVTSVLGIIAKPALVYWAAGKAAEFVDANLPVNQPLDEVEKKRLVEGAKTAHRSSLKDAADIGTLFHEYVEKYIKGEKPTKPKNKMLKVATENFHKWVDSNHVEFKSSERKILSLKHRYCGTCDFTAKVNGKNVVGDLKTSSGVWNEYWLQLAAYKGALLEEYPQFTIDHTLILRCGKDGSFEVKELNDFETNFKAFLSALELYRWEKQTKFFNYINNQ